MKAFRLGIVEGFYGRPWSWEERRAAARFMRTQDYSFYLYAPKGDFYLRRLWREAWPKEFFQSLKLMVEDFHSQSIEVGMGLSLHHFQQDTPEQALQAIRRKLREMESLGVDHVAILFDDMRGDLPDLAKRQIELVHAVKEFSPSLGLSMCPTYYSLDPLLDKLFGERPASYLAELGEGLDPSIEIFWTGEKICSKSYSAEHLNETAKVLKRPVLLWDNYPVNDTENMSRFLHLRAFQNRPSQMREHLSGHLINPMLQATLSQIPMSTLTESYRQGDHYQPEAAFLKACRSVLGEGLSDLVERDISLFQDRGLHELSEDQKRQLGSDYQKYAEHLAAREVLGWLDGDYRVTREQILAQQ
ncbi:MAG: beta-N-acetylglucosaminidase domain-containing protein [Bdellovibrionia bacterium]